MKKNKFDEDYSVSAILTCNLISDKYNYTARITRIWEFLSDLFSEKKLELLDERMVDPLFYSYLIDTYIDWCNGKDVDFEEVRESILKAGYFTPLEKSLLNMEDMNDKLWGIYIAILFPGKTKNIKL